MKAHLGTYPWQSFSQELGGSHPIFEWSVRLLNCLSANPHRREKIEVATKHYELTTDAANGFAVVFAKVGDGFEVRSQSKAALRERQLAVRIGLLCAS